MAGALATTLGSVIDIAGNQVSAFTSSFTTKTGPDFTRATALRSAPESGTTNVPVNAVVQLEFDEPIDSARLNSSSVAAFLANAGNPISLFQNLFGTF